jgi:hypothetical protein
MQTPLCDAQEDITYQLINARRPDEFSEKEQNSSVRRNPSATLDGQMNSVKKNGIRLSVVNPSAVAGSRNGARRPDEFSQKEQNSSVRRQPVRCRRLGTTLDGQTNSVRPSSTRPLSLARNDARRPDEFYQKEQNSSVHRRFVCCRLLSEWSSTARRIQSKRTEFVCPSSIRPLVLIGVGVCHMALSTNPPRGKNGGRGLFPLSRSFREGRSTPNYAGL